MVTSPERFDPEFIAKAADGRYREKGDIKGVALELDIRRNGNSKVGYLRYNGVVWGEDRNERLRLGLYDELGLPGLRRLRVAAEDLIRQKRSPRKDLVRTQEQQRAEQDMTLRKAMNEFFEHARAKRWKSDRTRIGNERCRRKWLEGLDIMDMLINDIRASHLEPVLKPKWDVETGIAEKMRSLLCSTFQFQMDKDNGVFRGPNPACWRQAAPLSRALGDPLPYNQHPGPEPEEVPYFIQHLRSRHDSPPEHLSATEATYAWELYNPRAISARIEQDVFKGVIKDPNSRTPNVNRVPISELIRVLGPPKRPPITIARGDVWLYDRLLQMLIFTPIRAQNACAERLTSKDVPEFHGKLINGLRWRNVLPDKLGGIIEYLPRRRDPDDPSKELPSEHKLGWKYPVKYQVIQTENLKAIIEEQRQLQISNRVEIKPDGLVFIHGPTRAGKNSHEGKHLGHRGAEDHLTSACDYLLKHGPIKTKKVTLHGLRSTFVLWAKRNDYSDDLIELSLGHILPAIRMNSTNWSYYHRVIEGMTDKRREMMEHWERHCLSRYGDAATADVRYLFPAASA